ncbi:MAG: glycosyltransferase [Candidatus Riflebacteria bacterium]|nr:glycosyltransferase [Candidatus Riflebacteria bacterium]
MKILQVINALTTGGAQTVLADLCLHLKREGHNPCVAAFRDGPIGEKLRNNGIETIILGEEAFDFLAFSKLCNIIKQFQPHIIHSHLFRASFWARAAAKVTGISLLITSVHGPETESYHLTEKKMCRISSHLIFPSTFLAEWYKTNIRRIPDHRMSVIYPGTNVEDAVVQTHDTEKLRIGSLSRLHAVKGVDTLLHAIHELKKDIRDVNFELHVGGDGKERTLLEELSQKLGISEFVKFPGMISSVRSFLDSLDIFVAPSREEAFGINVCEAMERSLPVIASRVGGIKEIIREEIDGLLVNPCDAIELKEKLKLLISDKSLRQSLGEAARTRINECFSRKSFIDKHLGLYKQLYDREFKNIQIALSSSEIGGGETLCSAIAASLKKKGWRINIICGGEKTASLFKDSSEKIKERSLKAGGIFFAAGLISSVKANSSKIIYSHLNKASLFSSGTAFIHRLPVIAHVHGVNRSVYYKSCDRIISVSKAVSENLIQNGTDPKKIVMIPNAVPMAAFSPHYASAANCVFDMSVAAKDHSSATSEINFADVTDENNSVYSFDNAEIHNANQQAPEKWNIAIIAKLHKNKGHLWALEAIENGLISKSLPLLEIHIFGDGPENEALHKRFSNEPGKSLFKFHGFRKNIFFEFKKFHWVLLPSFSEGIPLSLLEAMNFGIPAIASDVGGIPEIIENSYNGFLVAPGNVNQLLSILKQALTKETWSKCSKNSIEQFKKVNDFDKLAESVKLQLENLLER